MGTKSYKFEAPSSRFHIILNYKYCRVWLRRRDRIQHMEEYRIQINNRKNLDHYKKMFTLRINHDLFVNTLYFTHGSGSLLCGNYHQGTILLQRIPYRLCQFTEIPYQDIVSILQNTLKGFKILKQIYGFFKIKSTMIGFNNKWQIKIWHHTDLSSPLPQNQYCNSQKQMLFSLFHCLQKLSGQQLIKQTFSKFMNSRNINLQTFQQAQKVLYWYLNLYQLCLKNRFQNIILFLRQSPKDLRIELNQKRTSKSYSKFSFKTGKMQIKTQQKFSLNRSKSKQSQQTSTKAENKMRMFSANIKYSPNVSQQKTNHVNIQRNVQKAKMPSIQNSQYFSDLRSIQTVTRNTSLQSLNNVKKKKNLQIKNKKVNSFDSQTFTGDQRLKNKVEKILQKRQYINY